MGARPFERLLGALPVAALLLGAGVLGAIRDNGYVTDITWRSRLASARVDAVRSGRPVLVSCYDSASGWCRKLDAETFTNPGVLALARQCVCVRLRRGVDSADLARLRVHAFPTTLVLNPDGTIAGRIDGYQSPERFGHAVRALLHGAGP